MDNSRNDTLIADDEGTRPDNGATNRTESPNFQDDADLAEETGDEEPDEEL
jgi:hypothetical protein